MANKQCICPECGRVAEVRRDKRGARKRYMVCKAGHGGYNTRGKNEHWQSIEQDNLGIYGEFPAEPVPALENGPETLKNEPLLDNAPENGQFVPENADLPEVAEPETDDKGGELTVSANNGEENKGETTLPEAAKLVLWGVGLLLGGGAAYALSRKRGAK